MPNISAAHLSSARLNPFAFPSDTTLRFILLLIFIICGSGALSEDLIGDPAAGRDCVSSLVSRLSTAMPSESGPLLVQDQADIQHQIVTCSRYVWPNFVAKMIGISALLAVGLAIYWLYPRWKLRAERFRMPLSGIPDLENEIRNTSSSAGLKNPPKFLWNPVGTGLPLTFGHGDRTYVLLSGLFVSKFFRQDNEAFHAIIFHELAHVRNGDVDKTYLVLSFWQAFLITAILPGALSGFWHLAHSRWLEAGSGFVNITFWAIAVLLSGLAVLRVREHYADVRASTWTGIPGLERAIASLSADVGNRWRRCFSFHPSARERRDVVNDPSLLLRFRYSHAFGIGVAAWAATQFLTQLTLPFMPNGPRPAFVYIGFMKFGVPLVIFIFGVGAIGVGVWRDAFASTLRGVQPKGAGLLGASFVSGSFVSPILSGFDIFELSRTDTAVFQFVVFTQAALIAISFVLLFSCALIFRWIAQAGSAWIEIVLRKNSPTPLLTLTVFAGLAAIIGSYYAAVMTIWSFVIFSDLHLWEVSWPYTFALITGAPVLFISIVIWGLPLLGVLRARQASGGTAPWVFLDGFVPKPPKADDVRLGADLLTGIAAGLTFWLLWEVTYFSVYFPFGIGKAISSAHNWVSSLSEHQFGMKSFIWELAELGLQAVAAAIAAARGTRLNAIRGLFAAFIAGLTINIGWWLFFFIEHGGSLEDHLTYFLGQMSFGSAIALPSAILTASIVGKLKRVSANLRDDQMHEVSGILHEQQATVSAHKMRDRVDWRSVASMGTIAVLFVVVAVGMGARIRHELIVNAYNEAAEHGDPQAEFTLGMMYAYGKFIPLDKEFSLGHQKNGSLAIQWFSKAAQQGHADAQFRLGLLYENGELVTKDDEAAEAWFRKASANGHSQAVEHRRALCDRSMLPACSTP